MYVIGFKKKTIFFVFLYENIYLANGNENISQNEWNRNQCKLIIIALLNQRMPPAFTLKSHSHMVKHM